jgi:hypothetical protein
MTKHARSSVWNYFEKDFQDSNFALCLLQGCSKKRLKQSSENTSNLIKHLKSHHSKEYQEFADNAAAEKQSKKHKDGVQLTLEQT